jgi:hypothetical protein
MAGIKLPKRGLKLLCPRTTQSRLEITPLTVPFLRASRVLSMALAAAPPTNLSHRGGPWLYGSVSAAPPSRPRGAMLPGVAPLTDGAQMPSGIFPTGSRRTTCAWVLGMLCAACSAPSPPASSGTTSGSFHVVASTDSSSSSTGTPCQGDDGTMGATGGPGYCSQSALQSCGPGYSVQCTGSLCTCDGSIWCPSSPGDCDEVAGGCGYAQLPPLGRAGCCSGTTTGGTTIPGSGCAVTITDPASCVTRIAFCSGAPNSGGCTCSVGSYADGGLSEPITQTDAFPGVGLTDCGSLYALCFPDAGYDAGPPQCPLGVWCPSKDGGLGACVDACPVSP